MPADLTIPRDSVEYVKAPITLDVAPSMPIEMSLTTTRGVYVWQPATWVGALVTPTEQAPLVTRTARTSDVVTFSAANYPSRHYLVHVRPADAPEAPIIYCGRITLT